MLDWLAYGIHAVTAIIVVAVRWRRPAAPWTTGETAIGVVCAAVLLALTSGPIFIDFTKAYHYAGQVIVSDPGALYKCTRAQCYVNLPIVAWLFVPFGPLGPHVAGVIFSIIAAAALVPAARFLARDAPLPLVVWLLLLNGPLSYSVRIGNTTHVLLIVLIVAFEGLARGRDTLAGVLLAAAALLKPPLALFLPYLLLRGQRRAAVVMAAFAAAAIGLSIAVYGLDLHLFWFREFVVGHGGSPIGAYNVQSVNGFLAHLLTRGHLRDWFPIPMGAGFRVASLALTGAILAMTAAACWMAGRPRTRAEWQIDLSIVLTLTILTAPVSWTHYYLLLIIPIVALIGQRELVAAHRPLAAALAAAVVLISPPVVLVSVPGRIPSALYSRVAISHYFYGGVLLLGILLVVRLLGARGLGGSEVDWRGFRLQAEGDGCRANSDASRILPAESRKPHADKFTRSSGGGDSESR